MEHIRDINHNKKNTYLVQHFNHASHKGVDDFSVQIVEQLCIDDNQKRISREDIWIRTMNSAYPYGLNDKIKGYGNISQRLDPLANKNQPYFAVKYTSTRTRQRSTQTRSRTKSHKKKQDLALFSQLLRQPQANIIQITRLLFKANNSTIRKLYQNILAQTLLIPFKNITLIKGFLAGRHMITSHKKTTKHNNICIVVPYNNSTIESLQLPAIFNNKQHLKLLDTPKNLIPDIMVAYKPNPPISSKIFNYNSVLRDLTKQSLLDILMGDCHCQNSPYIYQPLGHIIAGNMDLVTQPSLKTLLEFGTKFRLPITTPKEKILKDCTDCLNILGDKLISKHKISPTNSESYKNAVLQHLKHMINRFYGTSHNEYNTALDTLQGTLATMRPYQEKFIITTADKANANYIFTCKKLYIEVLSKELGIQLELGSMKINGNHTYKPVNDPGDDIIAQHISFAKIFGVTITELNKKLPQLYCIPKLHKNPYKFRYIAGARHASTKQLSILLSTILKFLKDHFVNYCNIAQLHGAPPQYWSINNTQQMLNKVNHSRNIYACTSADFSTLYTSLEHNTVMENLCALIDMLFKNANKDYIHINSKNWVNYSLQSNRTGHTFHKNEIKALLSFIMENTYVSFAGLLFHQVKGIPMGGNASPLIADLLLSHLEFDYLRRHPIHAAELTLTTRYIDDILSINCRRFLLLAKDIYPLSLPLEDTTVNHQYTNYLDVTINTGAPIHTKLYDKREAFGFKIKQFIHATSAISTSTKIGTFVSQLIRTANICSKEKDFKLRVVELAAKFKSLGYNNDFLIKSSSKFFNKYPSLLLKYNVNIKEYKNQILQKIQLCNSLG